MNQALFRLARVFHKAVPISITVVINPFECTLDVRPDRLSENAIACALVVRPRKNGKQRSRVDASVITPEGNLSQKSHFIRSHLMDHLPGLGILFGVLRVSLSSRKVRENATGNSRIKPQALEGSDDSVAPEYSAKPWNSSVRIWTV